MYDRRPVTVRSAKCRSSWHRIHIYEFSGGLDGVDCAPFGFQFKINNAKPFITFAVDTFELEGRGQGHANLVRHWLKKGALLCVIDILCGRRSNTPNGIHVVAPVDVNRDPQKDDMRFFRKRCRYDILRVVHSILSDAQGSTYLGFSHLRESPLLTRLYEDEDLIHGLRYWNKEELITDPTLAPDYTIDVTRDEEVEELIREYDWEECQPEARGPSSSAEGVQADVFICHASEDKDHFVRSLAEALKDSGLEVWYDEYALALGDSLRRTIDRGLINSRFGVVVLSQAFFAKQWTQYELDGLVEREMDENKVILPIWHGVTRADVMHYSPALADRKAALSSQPLEDVVAQILKVVAPQRGEEDRIGSESATGAVEYSEEDIGEYRLTNDEMAYLVAISKPENEGRVIRGHLEAFTGRETEKYFGMLERFVALGLTREDADGWRLTTKGWDLADSLREAGSGDCP